MAAYLVSCNHGNRFEPNHGVSLWMHVSKSHKGEGQLHETHMCFDDRLLHRYNNCVMLLRCSFSLSLMV